MILWLEMALSVCFEESVAPRNFRNMCMGPEYKGKGDKYECNRCRGTCLMSVVRKMFGSVDKLEGTEVVIGEAQCGFRKG